jgi:hypothetical protein
MPVTDEQVAALRAYLKGDFAGHQRLFKAMGPREGFTALVPAAFLLLADRKFPEGTPIDRIVEFVGDVRARYFNDPDGLDPVAGERLLAAVNGDDPVSDIDPSVKYHTQLVLLYPIVSEESLSDQGIENLLATARKIADEWLEQS